MRGQPAKQLKQLTQRAGVAALTAFAFSVGIGVGALAVTAQHARAGGTYEYGALQTAAEIELMASREAWGAYGATAGDEYVAPAPDVHTVASALRLQSSTRVQQASPPREPLVSAASVARMVPGERSVAQVTFYYCAGAGVGDGGGFCGHAADGTPVQPGVAACDRSLMGQVFRVVDDPSGRVFRCADTGGGVFGQLRDIWFYTAAEAAAWLKGVGHNVIIEVLE